MSARPVSLFADPQAYQRFMGRWSAKLAPLFLDFAGVADGEHVLDVGAGTGNLSLAILERAPHAKIIGIDPSPAYVVYAQEHVRAGFFQVADAQMLPFDARSFDRALCQLVVNFIPDCARALTEMRRVTRPGGVIAATVWDLAGGMRMLEEFWETVGPLPDEQGRGEHRAAWNRDGLVALWSDCGLSDVRAADLTISTDFTSFDDYWSPFLLGQGPAGAYAASLSAAEQRDLRERLRRRILKDRADGPFPLPARAFAVRGIVP